MIKSFKHKGLEDLYFDGSKKGINANHAQKLIDILDRLDAITDIRDMRYPGADLHQLKGNFKEFWAVKISGNWRVIFKFINSDAFEVNYLDYH